jgi:hypothetical protein
MLRPIDNYFLEKEEPVKSCLLALRNIVLSYDTNITEAWKYGMPFYCFKGRMFCYLWVHKKLKQPYIGFVEGNNIHHPELVAEKRARMKILLLDRDKEIPVKNILSILQQAMSLYQ